MKYSRMYTELCALSMHCKTFETDRRYETDDLASGSIPVRLMNYGHAAKRESNAAGALSRRPLGQSATLACVPW